MTAIIASVHRRRKTPRAGHLDETEQRSIRRALRVYAVHAYLIRAISRNSDCSLRVSGQLQTPGADRMYEASWLTDALPHRRPASWLGLHQDRAGRDEEACHATPRRRKKRRLRAENGTRVAKMPRALAGQSQRAGSLGVACAGRCGCEALRHVALCPYQTSGGKVQGRRCCPEGRRPKHWMTQQSQPRPFSPPPRPGGWYQPPRFSSRHCNAVQRPSLASSSSEHTQTISLLSCTFLTILPFALGNRCVEHLSNQLHTAAGSSSLPRRRPFRAPRSHASRVSSSILPTA